MQSPERERRSRGVARRLDEVLLAELRADRYNSDAFSALLEELLEQTEGHWERLELRRRCAGLQFALAEAHGRGLQELGRLNKARERLGYSSLQDECGHLGLYAKALAERGKRAEGRAVLRAFADRVAKVHAESAYMRRWLAQGIKRL